MRIGITKGFINMQSMFLSNEEIIELTSRRRSDCQIEKLRSMGIEHRPRGDGSIAILRAHVNKVFGGIENMIPIAMKRIEPNWGDIR